MVDPRITVINEKLKDAKNIIAVSSGKGGVGKSLVASTLALILAKRGYKVGLFDLDFTSPSTHLILGVKDIMPEEEKGIIPPMVHGLKYMSITYFSSDYASPLRGEDVSNAIIELLAITRWGKLDFLIIDMPPGMGDELLEVITYIRRSLLVLVTTPSVLSLASARRLAKLVEGKGRLAGIIENMSDTPTELVVELANKLKATYLGNVPYVPMLEELMGKPYEMLNTPAGEAVSRAINLLELNIKRTIT